MSNIPAVVNIRSHASDPVDLPEHPGVVTPCVSGRSGRKAKVGIGDDVDCLHRADQPELLDVARGADATKGDLSEEEEDAIDNKIAKALSSAREDASTINECDGDGDGDDTATTLTDVTGNFGYKDSYDDCGSKACKLTPAAIKQLESNLKKEQDKVTKLTEVKAKLYLDLQASKLSARNLKEKHTNALAKKDNGEYLP
jgi:hypothetical protein